MLPPLRVGVAGLGTVGAAVLRVLLRRTETLAIRNGRAIVVTGVSSRDRGKARGVDLGTAVWHDDPVSLAQSPDIDCFVELIGGEGGPALAATRAALDAGTCVVTANKAMLAHHGLDLAKRAEATGAALKFEAAVAGGIPIVKTLREGLAGNEISRVYGILNGTCNYILSKMEAEKISFADCLSEAQRLGYAEADPTFDIGGFDTAHKLAILTSLAFGTQVDAEAVGVEGIELITLADLQAAEDLGFRVKLLGVAKRTASGIEQRVHPTMVPKDSAIAQIMDVTNAVVVNADAVREVTLAGPGAGGEATASAVVADIADVARGDRTPAFGIPTSALKPLQRADIETHEGGYYVRLALFDRPGAAAAIAMRMAEKGISLESIVQRSRPAQRGVASETPVPVTFITHATPEKAIREAIAAVVEDGHIAEKPQVIRIERE
jgi:homoserine dehydrogenase